MTLSSTSHPCRAPGRAVLRPQAASDSRDSVPSSCSLPRRLRCFVVVWCRRPPGASAAPADASPPRRASAPLLPTNGSPRLRPPPPPSSGRTVAFCPPGRAPAGASRDLRTAPRASPPPASVDDRVLGSSLGGPQPFRAALLSPSLTPAPPLRRQGAVRSTSRGQPAIGRPHAGQPRRPSRLAGGRQPIRWASWPTLGLVRSAKTPGARSMKRRRSHGRPTRALVVLSAMRVQRLRGEKLVGESRWRWPRRGTTGRLSSASSRKVRSVFMEAIALAVALGPGASLWPPAAGLAGPIRPLARRPGPSHPDVGRVVVSAHERALERLGSHGDPRLWGGGGDHAWIPRPRRQRKRTCPAATATGTPAPCTNGRPGARSKREASARRAAGGVEQGRTARGLLGLFQFHDPTTLDAGLHLDPAARPLQRVANAILSHGLGTRKTRRR